MRAFLVALLTLCVHTVSAQWVNYPTPGSPRTRDGRPDLIARAPRAPNGKPDLSGVWHVQPTSLAEMRRLFGDDIDKVQVPGMEIDTVSKYAINIFQDFTPAEAPVRPAVAEVLKRRGDNRPEALPLTYCLPGGVPLSTMLSEVSKIVQTPGLTLITIDDLTWYTKPITVKVTHLLQADTDILECFCNENEQDRRRMGL